MYANSIVANNARKKGNSKVVNFKTMESEVIVMIECNSVVVSLLVRVVVSISTSTIRTSVLVDRNNQTKNIQNI